VKTRHIIPAALFASALLSTLLCPGAHGQSFPSGKPSQSTAKLEAVQYLYPEQVTLPAGKTSPVALHFRIEPGFHINSHAPKDDFFIPTVFSIPADAGVKLETASYPPGADFVLPADPDTKLSVYTGNFTIQARLTAEPGDHLVNAKLRYQACDRTACMPPKTITVPIDIVGK
jgi:hypothetical protein